MLLLMIRAIRMTPTYYCRTYHHHHREQQQKPRRATDNIIIRIILECIDSSLLSLLL